MSLRVEFDKRGSVLIVHTNQDFTGDPDDEVEWTPGAYTPEPGDSRLIGLMVRWLDNRKVSRIVAQGKRCVITPIHQGDLGAIQTTVERACRAVDANVAMSQIK